MEGRGGKRQLKAWPVRACVRAANQFPHGAVSKSGERLVVPARLKLLG